MRGRAGAGDVRLRPEASIVLYLVSPDYALREGPPREFQLDRAAIGERGCEVFFASAVEVSEGIYRTVGTSRPSPWPGAGRPSSRRAPGGSMPLVRSTG